MHRLIACHELRVVAMKERAVDCGGTGVADGAGFTSRLVVFEKGLDRWVSEASEGVGERGGGGGAVFDELPEPSFGDCGADGTKLGVADVEVVQGEGLDAFVAGHFLQLLSGVFGADGTGAGEV